MSNKHTFYGGEANELGIVRALPLRTFREFVERKLLIACTLNTTRDQYSRLPRKQQQLVKRVPYVVPCCFLASPSRRVDANATTFNLICLDLDVNEKTGATPASPYFNNPAVLMEMLAPFSFAAYTTASSTPEKPKMRIMVHADNLPKSLYRKAVKFIARCIGLTEITTESFTVVQPMYLPTIFRGDDEEMTHPLLCYDLDGVPVTQEYIETAFSDGEPGETPRPHPHTQENTEDLSGNALEYLRTTVEEITLEHAQEALEHVDPDVPYPDWLEMAAALRHQFPGEQAEAAYELFDTWSMKGTKYAGSEDTRAKWDSLRPNPLNRAPVTIRTLLTKATQAGWQSSQMRDKCFSSTVRWIRDPNRTSGDLLSEGPGRILATPLVTQAEEEAMLNYVVSELRQRFGMKVTATTLRKDMKMLREKMTQASASNKKQLIPPWAKGLCYVASCNKFFRHSTGETFDPEAIDNTYSRKLLPKEEDVMAAAANGKPIDPSKPLMRPRDYLLNRVKVPAVYDFAYDPRFPNDTFITLHSRPCVNLYVPTYPEPEINEQEHAAELFLCHMHNLIREPSYRRVLMDFLAFLVQHPGRKIRWAVLLQGVEGCGKTFLAEAMRAVLGPSHVRAVDSNAIHGQWNEWAYGAQLTTIEEIRVAGQSRHEVMNALKPLISNDVININQRHRDSRQVDNTTNYLLFTNHHDALVLSHGDRRYFVLKSGIQTKAQVMELGTDYFRNLFSMLQTHAGGLRAWFENWVIHPSFDSDGHAPRTTYMQQLLHDTAPDALLAVREAVFDNVHPLVSKDLVSSTVLQSILETRLNARLMPSVQHLGSILREEGYVCKGRAEVRNGRHSLWVKLGSTINSQNVAEVARKRMYDWETIEPDDLELL
jgi:hypothetical protein